MEVEPSITLAAEDQPAEWAVDMAAAPAVDTVAAPAADMVAVPAADRVAVPAAAPPFSENPTSPNSGLHHRT